MSLATSVVSFGEWLPDLPAMNNPGLIRAQNVLPLDSGYGPFPTLDTSYATLPGVASSSFIAVGNSGWYVYASIGGRMYSSFEGGAFAARGTLVAAAADVSYTQFDNLVIVANNFTIPSVHTLGSASNFSTLSASTLPPSLAIDVVGRFVVIGGLTDGTDYGIAKLRWSGLNNPTSWPTANSATAIAQQAGEQILDIAGGAIYAIHGGDQYAVILQQGAITRMTYIGGSVVFQFDTISKKIGTSFIRCSIKVDSLVYFLSDKGFFSTDGVSVRDIGAGRIERLLTQEINSGSQTNPNIAYDIQTGLIYLAYSNSGTTSTNRILIYNPRADKFTYAVQDAGGLMTTKSTFLGPDTIIAFGTQANSVLGRFSGAAGTAIIETGDRELNPGGRAFVSGVKPNVESTGTAPAVTVRVGSRNDLSSTPTYTATTTPTTRTGYADCRVDAKYHRAEVQIVGNFTKAVGLEFDGDASGRA